MNGHTYPIRPPVYFIIRDAPSAEERLRFHVKTGDYFAMLATALGFVEEALVEKELTMLMPSPELALLRGMKKDLRYLHSHYDICEKLTATASEA